MKIAMVLPPHTFPVNPLIPIPSAACLINSGLTLHSAAAYPSLVAWLQALDSSEDASEALCIWALEYLFSNFSSNSKEEKV